MQKIEKLKTILEKMRSVVVAYSGGADSTFLLKIAHDCLGDRVLAVTAVSPTYPKEELAFARKMARAIGVRHKIVRTKEFYDHQFMDNPVNRCYFCKKELFARLKRLARKKGIKSVIDASNSSDKADFRPGSQAKKELLVRSPLQEAGFTKAEIRKESRQLGLVSWNKPAQACLASRVAYGVKLSPGLLNRINQGESFLKRLGLSQVRLRHYNGLCRIEVSQNDIPKLISRRKAVVEKFKALGYNHISVDLQGYRPGSLNIGLIK